MLKLNVGCGLHYKDGYVNIDIDESIETDVHAPAWSLPYEDNTVDEVFTSHLIEHFIEPDRDRALAEWWRVLKPDGLLVVRCPNIVSYITEWLLSPETRWGMPARAIWGMQNKGSGQLHHTGYDLLRLCGVLHDVGFVVLTAEIVPMRSWIRGKREDGDLLCTCVKLVEPCVV